ncbi:hypothetical protein H257_02186 [Aphanomyces astaci]|uniref:Uncharacterized protein n=1 Tax=Aphanomyces astaci TaxID=112090 RepID=W4H5E2_APHAT|nr:hypothetical protein H257_02186 [Aphanomyces astaci]ETV87220.1 hypothetical protein H257_02186 [Aphanomyces astaci]|eukprot:XP_009824019.1 hypothetical protein H257_02186 [Aphanomyces astaci]
MAEPKTSEDDDLKREMKKASKKSSKKTTAPPPGEGGPSLGVASPTAAAGAQKSSPPTSASTPQKPHSSAPKTPPQAQPSMSDVPKMNFHAANLGTVAEPKGGTTEGAMDDKLKKKSTKKKAPDATTAVAPPGTSTGLVTGVAAMPGGGAPTVASLQSPTTSSAKNDDEEERARAAARREAKRQKQKDAEEAKKRKEELERQALDMARREEEARQRELRKVEALAALNANAEECQEEDDYDEDFENYDDGGFEEPDEPAQAKKLSTNGSKSNQQSLMDPPEDFATVQKIREALQAESKPQTPSSGGASKKATTAKQTPAAPKDAKEAKGTGAKKATSGVSASIAGLKHSIDPRAKRVKEILDKKKMETERFDMFQLAPLTDFDKYMGQLRVCAVRQVFVQTNDDARSVQTQTKPRAMKDQSMLFPDDMGVDAALTDSTTTTTSSRRFIGFLARASHACEVLLEENLMYADGASNQKQHDTIPQSQCDTASLNGFSAKQVSINADHALFQYRPLLDMAFSHQVSHWLVGGYGPADDGDNNAPFADKSILSVWDINQVQSPVRWLRAEGVVSCVGFGPGRDMFVLSGSDEGAVQVWDLRLPPSPRFEAPSIKVKVEPPTYSTAGMKHDHNHTSPIAAVRAIPSGKKGANFQFGSLDNRGLLVVWSVIECRTDHEALSIDSCVEIGGRVKLVKTAVIDSAPSLLVGPSANEFAFFPADPNQFVVGTTGGAIVHGSRFDKKLGVKAYRRGGDYGGGGVSAVTSLAFHPTLPQYFLAGYADGSLSLFHVDLARDIASWYDVALGVSRVMWSPSRPSVFYVLYTNGTLTIWDLLTSRMMPVVTESAGPSVATKRKGKVLFALSADIARTCRPSIAIAGASSKPLAIHELCGPLTQKTKDETASVDTLLAGVV